MDNKEFLEGRVMPDYLKKTITELNAVYANETTHPLLTKQSAELGLLLLNAFSDKDPVAVYRHRLAYKDPRYNRIIELLPSNEWNDNSTFNLLVYFFGEEKAAYVKYAWERMPFQMYQVGYTRRSFRSPQDREMYFINQLNFLSTAMLQVAVTQYNPKAQIICYDLSVLEQIRYDHAVLCGELLFRIWAAAIDLDSTGVMTLLEDIIFNKDSEGKVTRGIIKALLNSTNENAWALVEKLLLSAQRQEGLRQTILEALDETSVDALK
jgi:hypothetical protein